MTYRESNTANIKSHITNSL